MFATEAELRSCSDGQSEGSDATSRNNDESKPEQNVFPSRGTVCLHLRYLSPKLNLVDFHVISTTAS